MMLVQSKKNIFVPTGTHKGSCWISHRSVRTYQFSFLTLLWLLNCTQDTFLRFTVAMTQANKIFRLSPGRRCTRDCALWWYGCPTVWKYCSSSSSSCLLCWSVKLKKKSNAMVKKEGTMRWRTWVSYSLFFQLASLKKCSAVYPLLCLSHLL